MTEGRVSTTGVERFVWLFRHQRDSMFSLCLLIISSLDGMMFTFSVLSMAVAPICEFGTMKAVHRQTSKGIGKEGKRFLFYRMIFFVLFFIHFILFHMRQSGRENSFENFLLSCSLIAITLL